MSSTPTLLAGEKLPRGRRADTIPKRRLLRAYIRHRGSDWVARHDATDLLLREQSNGTWILTDASSHATWGLWLLESIEAPGNGGRVRLAYAIQPMSVPRGAAIST